ncbi:MAG: hypothetical protein JNM76_06610 [Betaproteobacteria bacterium]|nr:hypothetical protein [Betaproteobacteria bacterium]
MAIDSAGNLYIADQRNHRIRKVNTNGVISTVAGNGSPGFSGDGAAATSASLNFPQSLTLDTAGNLYIADAGNRRIRKVNSSGVISTVAGNGLGGEFGGDGGDATSASLRFPVSVAADGVGNLYIADEYNHSIRKVDASGVISTVAGNGLIGFSGDGGAATSARLESPRGVAVDSAGNFYIADSGNGCIRKVSTGGLISTVAGSGLGAAVSGDGGAATSARLIRPSSVAVDSAGNLYIADPEGRSIRKVNTSGVISTVAGGSNDTDGRAGTETFLLNPFGITVDGVGNLFIADPQDHRIRKMNASGIVSTVAGNRITGGFGGDGEAATKASLRFPKGIAADSAGNLYIADSENHRIRKVSASGIISTVAGDGEQGFSGDGGAATSARLFNPSGVAVDSAGNLYIADELNHRVRKVSTTGVISTVAGDGLSRFNGDGQQAISTSLFHPRGVALDVAGNLYIADYLNLRVRKVNTTGVVSTVAGNGLPLFNGDGQQATNASLDLPSSVALDRSGNLYIADSRNQRIRMVNTSGLISTVAGVGTSRISFSDNGDGGAATRAYLAGPSGVAVDSVGNIYVADEFGSTIRKVNTSGVISRVAGSLNGVSGIAGFTGDSGLASSAWLNSPFGVAVDSIGQIYIADTMNHRIRKVTTGTQISNYQGAWWAGAGENGWGLSLIQHGQTLAAGWYYFNAQGQPTWAIVPGCSWNTTNTVCTGNVTTSTGSWLGNYTGIQSQNVIGTFTFSFTGPTTGTMNWSIGGVPGTKTISRLNYASGVSPSGIDYTDIWWGGASQNGWGVALLQQGGVLAGAWYTYNQQNQPVWYLINGGTWTNSNVFTAPLTRATGSPLIGATYNPSLLNASTAGTVTITFTDAANATMSYTVDGVTQTKSISRLAF